MHYRRGDEYDRDRRTEEQFRGYVVVMKKLKIKTPFIVYDDGNGDALYVRSNYIPKVHLMCLLADGIVMHLWDDEPACYRIDTLIEWYEKELVDCPNEYVRTIIGALQEAVDKFNCSRYEVIGT